MVGVVGSSPIAPTNFHSRFSTRACRLAAVLWPFGRALAEYSVFRAVSKTRANVLPCSFDHAFLIQMNTPVTVSDPALDESRLACLLRQAPLEFARVVYGLNDRANGRAGTMAAEDVARTFRQGVPVTRDRAEQRARAYLPTAGHEHCPRCWVFNGVKSPLHFRESSLTRPGSALCKVCGAEYATSLD